MLVEVVQELRGPVVVKRPAAPSDERRLAHEAAVLSRLQHPAVVRLLSDPSYASQGITTEYINGPALSDSPPSSPAEIAGLAATLAQAVGELHDLGIAHGRIDASHVLLTPDGSPVLCGFSGAGDDAAGDVAAIGRLILELLDAADPEDFASVAPLLDDANDSRDGYLRAALRELADAATSPVPLKRPTAHQLAASIMERIPQARLPYVAPISMPEPPRSVPGDGRDVPTRLVVGSIVVLFIIITFIVILTRGGSDNASTGTSTGNTGGTLPIDSGSLPGVTTTINPTRTTVINTPVNGEGCPDVDDEWLVDVNDDGCLDAAEVVAGTDSAGNPSLVLETEFGDFAFTDGIDTIAVSGDWDGNGKRSLGGVSTKNGQVFVFDSFSTDGLKSRKVLPLVAGASDAEVGDVDGDGTDEILVISTDGTKTFVDPEP